MGPTVAKTTHHAALEPLLSEHQNVLDDIEGFLDKCEELNQEVKAKVAEQQELFLKVVSVTPHIE